MGNAVGRRPEAHDLLANLQVAAVGRIEPAEDLQQGRLARAVLAHQRMHAVGPRLETDLRQRPDPGKLLADTVEAQARGRLRLFQHNLSPAPGRARRNPQGGRQAQGPALAPAACHFHSPILVSSCWKLARVIKVTVSRAVYLAGSLPVLTQVNIWLAVS